MRELDLAQGAGFWHIKRYANSHPDKKGNYSKKDFHYFV